MLILYPDTNALHADLLMSGRVSTELVNALLEGHVEVALSPVVLAEARRQTVDAAAQTARELSAKVKDVERRHGVIPEEGELETIRTLVRRVNQAGSRPLAPLVESSACRVLAWPDVDSQELVTRELDMRPPSQTRNGQTFGLRDTMIWHGLVDVLRHLDEEDEVVFITSDNGFLVDENLAPGLLEELDDEGIDSEQLRVVTRLETALVAVNERRELLSRLDGMIRQAVIDHMAGFDGRTWAEVDVTGDAALPFGVEEGLVVAVDSITIESAEGNPPTTLTATADITISGWMRSDEYVQEHSEVVEWTYGEIHDPMVGVDFTLTVALDAEVELSDDLTEAWVGDERLYWVD